MMNRGCDCSRPEPGETSIGEISSAGNKQAERKKKM